MKMILYCITLLLSLSSCTKDAEGYLDIRAKRPSPLTPVVRPPSSDSKKLSYVIPDVKTEHNFTHKVYIDPEYKGGGSNGTIEKPYTRFNDVFSDGIPPNTAFLFKRGTTLNEKIGRRGKDQYDAVLSNMIYNNNYFGSYGVGSKPVVRGFFIMPPSKDLTIRDLHIYGESQRATGWDALVYTHRVSGVARPRNITIAYNKIEGKLGQGYWDPAPYPLKGLRVDCDNLVVFNNEITKIFVDGIWVMGGNNHKYVRNFIHDINHHAHRAVAENWPNPGSNDPRSNDKGGGGDGIQVNYSSQDYYIAGNRIDRHHTMWKFCAIFGGNASSSYGWNSSDRNLVIEYNTFIAPKAGKGGSIIYFDGPKGTIVRKNVFDSTNGGKQKGVPAFAATHREGNLKDILTQDNPYGIRQNHIIRSAPGELVTGSLGNCDELVPVCNTIFETWADYQNFLKTNDQVGSDIDPDNFW